MNPRRPEIILFNYLINTLIHDSHSPILKPGLNTPSFLQILKLLTVKKYSFYTEGNSHNAIMLGTESLCAQFIAFYKVNTLLCS